LRLFFLPPLGPALFKKSALFLATCSLGLAALADEGQWQPHQLLQLKPDLKRLGISIPAEQLADLSKRPMSAMVSLGGCSASFVSPQGLVVTNHHCGYGAIQRNSTADKNYIANGFYAKTLAEELPGGPNERIYVTDKVENVTDKVLGGLDKSLSGKSYHEQVEKRIKALIAECEQDKAYRCAVPAFHRGLEYYRVRQMMIRDVRLVYAPSDKIGNFGGEVDNFEWPRHTGDFSFLRAYVGPDGKPADPSPNNVPYKPKDFLVVSAAGVNTGDAILLAGYPGRTSRYKLASEIRFARDVDYPRRVAEAQADIDLIQQITQTNPEWQVRYASVVKGMQNGMKRSQGMMDGFKRKDIAAIKDGQEAEFRRWLAGQPGQQQSGAMLAELDKQIVADLALSQEQAAFAQATHSELLRSARTLYRAALERAKPDAEREPGYQARDLPFIKARLTRLEQSFVATVDQARWKAGLQRYQKLPADTHPQGLDALLPALDALPALYDKTTLADTRKRLAGLEQDADALAKSDDPLLQLAVKLQPIAQALEDRRKEVDGKLERVIPQYMQALIAWNKARGKPVYPDANGTLRVSIASVAPYSPADGVSKGPFTTVEGVVAKTTGKAPFESPKALMDEVAAKHYGVYKSTALGTVPVDFLSTADTTGGSSGSAVMNAKGELVGLNFDSTYESITKDWYFDPTITRAIHVDMRYVLWVMSEVDHADRLLKEMTIRYPAVSKK
jgi:hypothetical protein